MVKKVLCLLVIILLIPMVLGFDFFVTIQTEKDVNVNFRFLDKDTGTTPQGGYFSKSAGDDGKIELNYSSDDILMKASLRIESDGTYISLNNSEYYYFVGEELLKPQGINYIDVTDASNPKLTFEDKKTNIDTESEVEELELVEEVNENETIVEQVVKTEEVEETVKTQEIEQEKQEIAMTGGLVSVFTSKKIYYGLGAILIIIVVAFVVLKTVKRDKGPVIKYHTKEDKEDQEKEDREEDERLRKAKEKLKEAQKELDDIQNRDNKIKEARERIEKEQEELKRLGAD